MLKQRIKDVEYREQVKNKYNLTDGSKEQILIEKLKRHETSLVNLDRENQKLKSLLIAKEQELTSDKETNVTLVKKVVELQEQIAHSKKSHAQNLK